MQYIFFNFFSSSVFHFIFSTRLTAIHLRCCGQLRLLAAQMLSNWVAASSARLHLGCDCRKQSHVLEIHSVYHLLTFIFMSLCLSGRRCRFSFVNWPVRLLFCPQAAESTGHLLLEEFLLFYCFLRKELLNFKCKPCLLNFSDSISTKQFSFRLIIRLLAVWRKLNSMEFRKALIRVQKNHNYCACRKPTPLCSKTSFAKKKLLWCLIGQSISYELNAKRKKSEGGSPTKWISLCQGIIIL